MPYATSAGIYAASIVLPILGVVLVVLRLNARRLQKASTGWDDFLMLPALCVVIGMGITLCIGVHGKAIGYPTPYEGTLTPEERMTTVNPTIALMGKVQYAFCLLMVLAFGFLKLSITFFYRRLFVTARKTWFDWATKVVITIVLFWAVGFFFGFILGCGVHPSAGWRSVKERNEFCASTADLDNGFVVSDLITDIMVLVLPLPVIWNLHTTVGKKLMVMAILATGAVSVVASIIKVVVSYEITNAGFNTKVDPDLTVSTILYWSMIEAGLAIIAACLPTLQYLVRKVTLDKVIRSVRSTLSLHSNHSQQNESWPMGGYINSRGSSKSASTTETGDFTTDKGNVAGLEEYQAYRVKGTDLHHHGV